MTAGRGETGGPRRPRGWALAAGLWGFTLLRLGGADRHSRVGGTAAALLPFTPQAAAAGWIAALASRDRKAAMATAGAAAVLTAAVLPRVVRRRQPEPGGPVLRVLTANLLGGRADAGCVVDLIDRLEVDVLFLQELTSGAAKRLDAAGLEYLLPHAITDLSATQPRGNAIYAVHPLDPCPPGASTSSVQPAALVRLPDGEVRVSCVHLHTPKWPWPWPVAGSGAISGASRWRRDVLAVGAVPVSAASRPGEPPLVMAGDFNATVDHAGFREVLDGGLVDAASQRGSGLVPTWGPLPGGRGALLTIDHVLADRRCAVLSTSVHSVPGTDHRALFAALRLPELPLGTRHPWRSGLAAR